MDLIEGWAAAIIEHELGTAVHVHDDQSRDSMYDLRVGDVEAPFAAIEVTRAASEPHMEAIKALPHRIEDAPSLTGLWAVSIEPARARIKKLRSQLEPLLTELEATYADEALLYSNLRSQDQERLTALGIRSARRLHRDQGGAILLSMPSEAGFVTRDDAAFIGWIGSFLTSIPDVLHKLRIANAIERHVFVPIVAPHGAPWAVTSFLSEITQPDGSPAPCPQRSPTLPAPLTHAWFVGTADRFGWRWDGTKWVRFQAAGPPIDDRYPQEPAS